MRGPVRQGPMAPWLMPATTIFFTPLALSFATEAPTSSRQPVKPLSKMRFFDQHISGVSTA